MANINDTTLNSIAQGQTVFVEADNEVYQWKQNLTEWNAAAQAEGSTTTVGDAYKATSQD